MIRKYFVWIFFAVVIVLPIAVYGAVKWYENNYTRLPVMGGNDHRIGEFVLTSHLGKETSLKDWEGKIVVADFFFTHCPVVCPKMTRNMKRVQQSFAGDELIQLVSFSVDPERDSVEQLNAYRQRMDIRGNWLLVTGSKKEIYRLARNSFMVVATDGDGGPDDFIHSELLVLIDPQKRIRGFYNGTVESEADDLLRDIGRLKKEIQ